MTGFPTAEDMLAQARAATGLADFGPEEFLPAMSTLLAAVRDEANLTERGLAAELDEMHGLLVNRLRMEEMFRRYPEIAEERIERPVIIVGPQRSGTSKLFRVIAADPQWNYLPTWQGIDPVPPGMVRPDAPGEDERLAESDRWVESMADRQSGHSFETRSPEMEALLMRDSFMINSGKRLVPTHQRFVEEADHAPVYRRLRRQLQLLQWQNRTAGKRWILKTPPHLMGIQALADEFADATLVMTHRHPAESIASMCRLTEVAQKGSARTVDYPLIGRCWGRIISFGLSNFLRFEDNGGADRVVHVTYRAVEGDGAATARAVYAKAGADFNAASAAAIAEWEAANPRHKDGGFSYRLEDYGLSRAQVEQDCAAWLERYGHLL